MSDFPEAQPGGPTERDERLVAFAVEKVRVPGVLMIVLSVLLMAHATIVLLRSSELDQQFEGVNEQIENDPKYTDQEKQDMKAMAGKTKDALKVIAPAFGVTWAVLGPVICLCAVKMMTLSSRGLALLGACLAMTPFTAGCCSVPGVALGIWVLVTLSNPDVKAAFEVVRSARARAAGPNPDGY